MVETHGTGTALGDPIELGALRTVQGNVGRAGPLLLGALKTNVGHALASSGLLGLAKCYDMYCQFNAMRQGLQPTGQERVGLRFLCAPSGVHLRQLNKYF